MYHCHLFTIEVVHTFEIVFDDYFLDVKNVDTAAIHEKEFGLLWILWKGSIVHHDTFRWEEILTYKHEHYRHQISLRVTTFLNINSTLFFFHLFIKFPLNLITLLLKLVCHLSLLIFFKKWNCLIHHRSLLHWINLNWGNLNFKIIFILRFDFYGTLWFF